VDLRFEESEMGLGDVLWLEEFQRRGGPVYAVMSGRRHAFFQKDMFQRNMSDPKLGTTRATTIN